MIKKFEIVCPLNREPRAREIDAKAGGWKYFLRKRSIDARKEPVWRYMYEAYSPDEEIVEFKLEEYRDVHDAAPVLIVGAGPAGMFAALKLLTLGVKPIILERGRDVHARKADMAVLSREGRINPDSNYCYGEGGAGAFSDGKLYTRSSKRGDNREVLAQLVKFGANPSIMYDAHPHLGSDKLPSIVEKIRECIVEHGGEYHFESKVTSIDLQKDGTYCLKTADSHEYHASKVILATGHSARDIYEILAASNGALEAKGFALGVRAEHPQEKINWCQYHGKWQNGMPAAEYSFVEQVDGRGVFSFCMCPGGILVPSSTQEGTIVLNGMSNSARSGKFANSGVVVQIEPGDIPGDNPFRLMDFQLEVERRMFEYSAKAQIEGAPVSPGSQPHRLMAPAQRMEDFCLGKRSKSIPATSYFPGAISAPLHELLPPIVATRLQKAFPQIKMKNYYTNAALLLAVESRTSSPIRIPRDEETLEYVSMPGLYPCGEGAGYSGGIVSSAIDGIRCAAAAASSMK